MAGLYSGLPIDQPSAEARRDSHASEAWVEPWLIKHVGFYRKHMTKDHKGEPATERRQSLIAEDLQKASRENSVAAEGTAATASAAAPAVAPAVAAVPGPVEQEARGSTESADSAHVPEPATTTKKDKVLHGWRKRMGWLPHP